MLHVEKGEIVAIPARKRTPCAICEERVASWETEPLDCPESTAPMCGWCVLYGGSTWGHLNRDEIVYAGVYVRAEACRRMSPRTKVPELDERHRLQPEDADRYLMGIIFTSALLNNGPLGRLAGVTRRALDLLG